MLTSPLILDLKTVHFTDEQFYQLCITNPDVRVERNSEGGLILMPPVGGYSGNQEIELGAELVLWNRQSKLGKVFSSSTIFRLPSGGDRSPDAAWVKLSRWQALTPEHNNKNFHRLPPILFWNCDRRQTHYRCCRTKWRNISKAVCAWVGY